MTDWTTPQNIAIARARAREFGAVLQAELNAAADARVAAEQSRRAAARGEQLGMFDVTTDLVEPGMNGVIF